MHKNTISYLFCFLFSASAFSQIQSGGGPDDEFAKLLGPMGDNYKTLLTSFNKKWQKCGNDTSLEFNRLSEVYLQLTWKNAPSECAEDKKKTILTCFYDDTMKNDIHFFLTRPKVKEYLRLVEDKEYVDLVFDYLNKASKQ